MISRNACFWINCLVSSNDSFRQIIELLKFLNLKQGHMGGRTIPFLNHHHLGVTNRRFGLVIKAHTECIVKPLLPDNKAFSRPLARMALGCDTQQLRWKQNDGEAGFIDFSVALSSYRALGRLGTSEVIWQQYHLNSSSFCTKLIHWWHFYLSPLTSLISSDEALGRAMDKFCWSVALKTTTSSMGGITGEDPCSKEKWMSTIGCTNVTCK